MCVMRYIDPSSSNHVSAICWSRVSPAIDPVRSFGSHFSRALDLCGVRVFCVFASLRGAADTFDVAVQRSSFLSFLFPHEPVAFDGEWNPPASHSTVDALTRHFSLCGHVGQASLGVLILSQACVNVGPL